MKKQLVIMLLFAWGGLRAQVMEKEGPVLSYKNVPGIKGIIGADKTGIYVERVDSKGSGIQIYIEKLDPNTLTTVFSKKTDSETTQKALKADGSAYNMQACFFAGKVHFFFEAHDKENDKQILFLQTIDPDGVLSQVYEVASIPMKLDKNIIGQTIFSHFWVSPSPKGNYFFINDFSDNNGVTLYKSSNLGKLWQKNLNGPEGKNVHAQNCFVADNGNFYYSLLYSPAEGNIRKEGMVAMIESTSPTVKSFELKAGEKQELLNVEMKVLDNSDLFIAAVCADTATDSKGKKIYNRPEMTFKRIDATSFNPVFDFKTMVDQKIFDEKLGVSKGFDRQGYYSSIEEVNGRIYVIIQTTNERGMLYSQTGMSPILKDVVIVQLSADGKVNWQRSLPRKHPVSLYPDAERPATPTFFDVIGGRIRMIYYENPLNEGLSQEESSDKFQLTKSVKDDNNAVCVTINEDGSVSKNVFYRNTKGGLNYIGFDTRKISENKIVVYFEDKKKNMEKLAIYNFE